MFEISEPIIARWKPFVPKNVLVDHTHFPEAKLIRLLIGTASMSSTYLGIEIDQRRNLSDALGVEHDRISSRTIKNALKQTCDVNCLATYLDRTGANNYSLFQSLLHEYCWYFYHQERGEGVAAFLYLYRILERSSYSFPLIHASSSKSFVGTYDALSSYFKKATSGEYGGELKFFNVFVENIFDNSMLDSSVDLFVAHENSEMAENIYSGLKSILCGDGFNQAWMCDDSRLKIENKYRALLPTIIHLRNRYFHFAIGGQKNIASQEMFIPDQFFWHINPVLVNWISIVYFEVLKIRVETWS